MKVLVCDDEAARCEEVIEAIAKSGVANVEPVPLAGKDLTNELTRLFELIDGWLKNPESYSSAETLSFDSVDVAIFDNNLAHLDIKGTRLTAESVIGYVRAFTAVPYIVSLNKNPDVDFDLRFLVGDYETRADMALNTEHLSNRALWTGKRSDAPKTFLPWYWPELLGIDQRRRAQIAFVKQHLHDPVFPTLGIPTDEQALGFLSLHAKGALSPDMQVGVGNPTDDGISIEKLTFHDVFAGKSRSLSLWEERERIVKAVKSGQPNLENLMARVVAADIDLWFRRDLVGPQEMFVDVPHLLMRMPFLVGNAVNDLDGWNAVVSADGSALGLDPNLFEPYLKSARIAEDLWLPNPAFHWRALKTSEELNKQFFESGQTGWADAVFCEDTSSFRTRTNQTGAPSPVGFTAEFEGSWAQRYVAKIEGFSYTPLTRLLV